VEDGVFRLRHLSCELVLNRLADELVVLRAVVTTVVAHCEVVEARFSADGLERSQHLVEALWPRYPRDLGQASIEAVFDLSVQSGSLIPFDLNLVSSGPESRGHRPLVSGLDLMPIFVSRDTGAQRDEDCLAPARAHVDACENVMTL
jgi:hypothetical protein